ncbi:Tyrosine-protein kinase YwqD [Clostridiales bacterium CHKCI001]|nr:Tyrosine-protein kinase YwqD [Clostridiales bacterium CHKCI001]
MTSDDRIVLSKTLGIDVAALFRSVFQKWILILMCSVTFGIITYIGVEHFIPPKYSITSSLVVVSKDNSTQNLREYRYSQAITQYTEILNSDIYRELVQSQLEGIQLNEENLKATVGESSNMIVLKATDEKPENAFRILSAAMNSYEQMETYAMTGYIFRTLSSQSVDQIQIESNHSLLLALEIGLLVMIAEMGFFMLLHLFRDKIDNEKQAISKLDAAFLGSVPYVKRTRDKFFLFTEQDMKFKYKLSIKKIADKIESKLVDKQYRTILISSVFENEGKSTVAANIAIALANKNKKVLIMDMDLRKPALNKVLGYPVSESKEIVHGLAKKLSYEELVSYDKMRGIYYIVGSIEIEGNLVTTCIMNLPKLLDEAKNQVDYIIMDSSPIALTQDTELLGEWTDAMIMVVRQNTSSTMNINDSIDTMNENGVDVMGIILNAVETKCIPARK